MTDILDQKTQSEYELSVVVPSVNTLQDLFDCLHALEAQAGATLEILVVDRLGEEVRAAVRERHPRARVIGVPRGTTIPRMRAIAFAESRGNCVAVIEDHVIVPPDWARRLLDAQAASRAVVGGSVENAATERLVDWAAFLCEYSHCIPPLPAGPADWLTGNNVVYPRALLERHRSVIEEGRWENHLHDALKRDGVPLICHPEIAVGHKKHYTVGEYLSQRYLYARSYAGARVTGQPLSKRAAYGLAALALPPLLFYRTLTRVVAKGRHRGELLRSLPLLALFVTSWALGEVVGYWAGPGDSLGKVC
jgi:glycosyltransferase involved in cell wall biosynthesis